MGTGMMKLAAAIGLANVMASPLTESPQSKGIRLGKDGFTPKQWKARKKRLKMQKESRKQNRVHAK